MNLTPKGLWETGTYWHLDTRPDELGQMSHTKLKRAAQRIDEVLKCCKFQTIVHGDAKLANFCFSAEGDKVAAVDFQYVGGGCGMKDVAYFLGSCLDNDELQAYESELLSFYFMELKVVLKKLGSEVLFEELEEEWREMYPFACADFMRFLLGWMPGHHKINSYNLKMIDQVLKAID